jgi:hypothetical protein
MTFHNYLKRKILALEFLVEYFDREGNPLTRVPYIALNANQKFRSDSALRGK